MASWTGVCRIRGEADEKTRVRITDGKVSHDELTEQDYRSASFQPPFDTLPWLNGDTEASVASAAPSPSSVSVEASKVQTTGEM